MPSKLQLLPPDIGERLKHLPDRVAGTPGLRALWLFGSFARGEATPISDVDLAFLADTTLRGEALEGFETELYTTIARSLHTDEFTFVNLRRAPTALAWQVVVGGRLVFCRDEEECDSVRTSAFQRFPDTHTYTRERWQALDDWLEGKRMPVDKARVYALLEGIREELGYVGEIAAIPREEYLHDRRTQRLAERCLQRAAEGCISIGNHLIARLGLRAPSEYAEVFGILGEAKIVPWEIAREMADMAKFRNLLVHVYWAIDHERLYDALRDRLTALESFARHIARWLQDHETGGRTSAGGNK